MLEHGAPWAREARDAAAAALAATAPGAAAEETATLERKVSARGERRRDVRCANAPAAV
jgi:hypothetical protein